MVIFDHAHPKIIESTFSFPEFVPAWKKWLYSICLFFSPVTRLVTPIFDHAHPKMFWSAFNFCDHVLICKKSVHIFHLFILQIQSILESHHQTSHIHFLAMLTHFWTNQLVHQTFLEIQLILEFRDQIGHIHFWQRPSKNFSINF